MANDYMATHQRNLQRNMLGLMVVMLAFLAVLALVVILMHRERMACIEAGKQVIGERCVEKEKTDG